MCRKDTLLFRNHQIFREENNIKHRIFRFRAAFVSFHKWLKVLSVTNRESSVTNRNFSVTNRNFSVTNRESPTSHWRNGVKTEAKTRRKW